MLPPHLAHCRLNTGTDLVRTRFRPPGTIGQRTQAALLITTDPGMHALPRHPSPGSGLSHRHPGFDLQDSAIPLLDNGHLHQCQSRPPATRRPQTTNDRQAELPAPVNHVVGLEWADSTGVRKELGELFRWCHEFERLAGPAIE